MAGGEGDGDGDNVGSLQENSELLLGVAAMGGVGVLVGGEAVRVLVLVLVELGELGEGVAGSGGSGRSPGRSGGLHFGQSGTF